MPGIPNFQASHSRDPVAGNNKLKGAESVDTNRNSDQGDLIFSFKKSVQKLGGLLQKAIKMQG